MFVWVISIATVGALWTWAMILIAHMGYRKAVAEGRAEPSSFRMPGAPITNWIALAFIVAGHAVSWLWIRARASPSILLLYGSASWRSGTG